MAVRKLARAEYMVRWQGNRHRWNDNWANQVPTVVFGERFWHVGGYLIVQCDHRHVGASRSLGNWKKLPALCIFRPVSSSYVHVGYFPLPEGTQFVEIDDVHVVYGPNEPSSVGANVTWCRVDFSALDSLSIRTRFAGPATAGVPRLGDVPASFSGPPQSIALPNGIGKIAKSLLAPERLVLMTDTGKVLTQARNSNTLGKIHEVVLPANELGTLGQNVHCRGAYIFISGSSRGRNDSVHQFLFPAIDTAPELLTTVSESSTSIQSSGISLFILSPNEIAVYDVDLMDHVEDIRLPWTMAGTESTILGGGVAAFALAVSKTHPFGGYGVYNVLQGRQLGTLKFASRHFSERQGRHRFSGDVYEYPDGRYYRSPYLCASSNSTTKFFASYVLSNMQRHQWPPTRNNFWPTVLEIEFDN